MPNIAEIFLLGNWETGPIIRHFEVPAFGGFQLAYDIAELSNCFQIGTECDVFHDEAELLEKIQYYLSHPEQRREIAAAGQQRVLAEHLYSHRMVNLVELLEQARVLPRRITTEVPKATVPRIRVEGVTDQPVNVVIPEPLQPTP